MQSKQVSSGVQSELNIIANITDNQAIYRCEAKNSATDVPLFDKKTLSVHCEFSICMHEICTQLLLSVVVCFLGWYNMQQQVWIREFMNLSFFFLCLVQFCLSLHNAHREHHENSFSALFPRLKHMGILRLSQFKSQQWRASTPSHFSLMMCFFQRYTNFFLCWTFSPSSCSSSYARQRKRENKNILWNKKEKKERRENM